MTQDLTLCQTSLNAMFFYDCFSILRNTEFHGHDPQLFYRTTILEYFIKFPGKHLQWNATLSKTGCAKIPKS